MQTFLPYESFAESAKVLDYRRLGKQRVEANQILNVLAGRSSGWKNHPAVKMWRGYDYALMLYYDFMVHEWTERGYKNTMPYLFPPEDAVVEFPEWIGREDFHRSHQSNLVRKAPEYYQDKFRGVPDCLPYVWPKV